MAKQEEIDIVAGVPQGGPISPTIANMVLDGLEKHVKIAVAHLHDEKNPS
jgi:retron-type reverse transcriptase